MFSGCKVQKQSKHGKYWVYSQRWRETRMSLGICWMWKLLFGNLKPKITPQGGNLKKNTNCPDVVQWRSQEKGLKPVWSEKFCCRADSGVPPCLQSKERFHLVDAGLLINVPYPSFLGHKRDIDLIIAPEYSAGNMFEVLQSVFQCAWTLDQLIMSAVQSNNFDTINKKKLSDAAHFHYWSL